MCRGRGIRAGSEWVDKGRKALTYRRAGFLWVWRGGVSPIAYVSMHQNPEVW